MKENIYKIKNTQKGFSVVELVVVISIFIIMLSVTMYNYNDTSTKIEATNLAEDIALSLRQSQVYGLSSSERYLGSLAFDEEQTQVDYFENQGEGRDITQDKSIVGVAFYIDGSNRIYLFEDLNHNYQFDGGDVDRIIDERLIYAPDISIQKVRMLKDNTWGDKQGGVLYISFMRPYPDAYILYKSGSSVSQYDGAEILISDKAAEHDFKKVFINSIGNIIVRRAL